MLYAWTYARPARTPAIPGYNLASQNEVLVVGYAAGCSCDIRVPSILDEALHEYMVVLVVGDNHRSDLVSIKSIYEKRGVVVLLGVARNIMQEFCPHGSTTLSLVRRGYIIRQKQAAVALREVIE